MCARYTRAQREAQQHAPEARHCDKAGFTTIPAMLSGAICASFALKQPGIATLYSVYGRCGGASVHARRARPSRQSKLYTDAQMYRLY